MNWFTSSLRSPRRRPIRRSAMLSLETLEDRTVPSSVMEKPALAYSAAIRTTAATNIATPNATATSGIVAATTTGKPLATLALKPLDLKLLGLEVTTSPITITLGAQPGNGQLLGNLLNTANGLINLNQASTALNRILASTVNLLNSASLSISNASGGAMSFATASTTKVATLTIAPVHLNLLGVIVTTSTIHLKITAHSGNGLILGNVIADLANLFNPPLPSSLNIDSINNSLKNLLNQLEMQIPGVSPAPVQTVQPTQGQIVSLTVPPLDLNLLGLGLQTSAITVNATAQTGNGLLLGNILQTGLNTLNATPQNLADLSNNLNNLLAEIVGILNSSSLTLSSKVVNSLPSILKTLIDPTLTAPSGSTTQILNLVIDSQNGTSPPVNVNLLGLNVTTSNIDATLTATTGTGNVLGNLLYNLANLANPSGPAELLHLFSLIASGANSASGITDTNASSSSTQPAPQQLLQIKLNPLDINLLGLQVQAFSPPTSSGGANQPITVTISTQQGNGELLGNLLTGISSLLNVPAINTALTNVLDETVNLVNSVALAVNGVGSGNFTNPPSSQSTSTPILNLFVAPVHLNLLGLLVDTSPIQVTITANTGQGQVLGNVLTDLANLFNPPLPSSLNIDTINSDLANLLSQLNQQIPTIAPSPVQQVNLKPGQVVSLTVPPINLNLLGLLLKTSPITVNAAAQTGNGDFLGNVLTTILNSFGATPANLSTLSNDLNAILAKVVGVLNVSSLTLPSGTLSGLPTILQTLAAPNLLTSSSSATSQILNLIIASPNGSQTPPVDVNLLGLDVTTSNITAELLAKTGNGQILGNLLYNIANLLNPNEATTLLFLLAELGQITI